MFAYAIIGLGQLHDFNGSVAAEHESAAVVDLAGVAESAFLHDAPRGWVVHEEIAPDSLVAFLAETVIQQKAQRLGAKALVPVWSRHPIAGFHIVFAYPDVALAKGEIADAADGFTGFFQLDCPSVVVVKNRLDDFPTLLHTQVRRPAGTRAHLQVTGVTEQRLGVTLPPGSQKDSIGFHCLCHLVLVGTPARRCKRW